jgi:hypothetical protein
MVVIHHSRGRGGLRFNQILCVNLCVKQFPKSAKTWTSIENMTIKDITISISYPNFSKLGNSGVMTANP